MIALPDTYKSASALQSEKEKEMLRKQRTGRAGILNYRKTFYFLETNVQAKLLVRCMSKDVFETVSHLTTLLKIVVFCWLGFPGNSDGKEFFQECRRPRFDPWVGKIPWRMEWQPTPVFLPGESHGQRSLVGYSPWNHKQLDTTGQLITHSHQS